MDEPQDINARVKITLDLDVNLINGLRTVAVIRRLNGAECSLADSFLAALIERIDDGEREIRMSRPKKF